MSFSLFDYHNITTISAFKGFNSVGYVLFGDKFSGEMYYKSYDSSFSTEVKILTSNNTIVKEEISFYSNQYLKEIYCVYRDYEYNIYSCIFKEDGNNLVIKYPDKKIISGGKEAIAIYDAYAQAYIVFYIKISDSKMYQAVFDPYDTFKSELIIDTSVFLDIDPTLGSDFRVISMSSTQMAANNYYNLYSIRYDNTDNISTIR